MAGQIYDIDTVGYGTGLGDFFDFNINNTFYFLAPEYYRNLYTVYFKRCLQVYDGWIAGWHNRASGLVPQKSLQSIATGLTNILFARGIDFSGDDSDYDFAVKWAKKTGAYQTLKKLANFGIAGGTSLLKINRSGKDLFFSAHRIDSFYPDIDANGKITSCKIYFDAITNVNKGDDTGTHEAHYGLCEERYFNKEGIPCVKSKIYEVKGTLQNSITDRANITSIEWDDKSLPHQVKEYIKKNYPSIVVGKEQYLPFKDSLGLHLWKFTDNIPQFPLLPFGQPIGDILWTESFQFDQLKYFEKNEVDLARARALVPEEFWNKDDPAYDQRALNERFYQKVQSINDDDKVTPIQFEMRSDKIRGMAENIFKDMSFKLNVSASTIATFLNEGAGARTATEIVNERTKTDTWSQSEINLNIYEMNKAMEEVMRYYNHQPVELLFRVEDQSPHLETLKAYGDAFAAGNVSTEMFVKKVYKNLSQAEQKREIDALNQAKAERQMMKQATINSWRIKSTDKNTVV